MRHCSKCDQDKPEDEFYSRTSWCKDCNRKSARVRYHRRKAEHPDQVRIESARSSRKLDAKIRAEGGSRHEALKRKTRQRVRRYRGTVTDEDVLWETILEVDPCSYCGELGGQIDHIEPWSQTQDGNWLNLTGACPTCNQTKRDHSLLSFLLNH